MKAQNIFAVRALAALVFLACMLLDGTALAQEVKRPVQKVKRYATEGIVELGGTASFLSTTPVVNDQTGSAAMTLTAMPLFSYFITDGFALGFSPIGLTYRRTEDNTGKISEGTDLAVYFAPMYVFETGSGLYPFVEGLAGYTSQLDFKYSGISYGGAAGMKMMLLNRGLLNFDIKYLIITLNASSASKRSGSNDLSVSMGYSIWF